MSDSNKPTQKLAKWKASPLLLGISDLHISHLEDHLEVRHYNQGEYIIRDGDTGDDIFIIENGQVDIKKHDIRLATKSSGEHFGAMAMLDNSIRSADVIVASKSITTMSLPVGVLKSLDREEIYQKMMTNHIKEQQSNLRNMNLVTVAEVKAKLEETQARLQAGSFFVALVFGLIIYQWILGAFIEYTDVLRNEDILTILNPLMMIIMGIAAYIRAVKSDFSMREYGLNFDNWKKNLAQSIVWTILFLIVLVLLKWLATLFVPAFQNKPVFDFSTVESFSVPVLILIYTAYALISPIQEFIARGVIQTSLEKLLTGEKKVLLAIFLSNLAFSSFHIHMDMRFALLTLVPGFFWGIMYHRQKSLLGVSVSHAIIGIFVFVCMGLV